MTTPTKGPLAGVTSQPDRGSATLELVVVAPALLVVLGLLIGAGRIAMAAQTVQQAAHQAARAASLARSPAAGTSVGQSTATAVLAGQGLNCTTTRVSLEAGALAAPAGTPGTVSATVSCTVPLADLAVPGLPGSRTLTSTGQYAIDTYVQRG
ncbi:MAG: TadE/TadG family type IV pilus assembly protein [Candidatus Nanopelagicales bacterium]